MSDEENESRTKWRCKLKTQCKLSGNWEWEPGLD